MRGRPAHHYLNVSMTTSDIFQDPPSIKRIDLFYELPIIFMKHMQDPEMNCPYNLIIERDENEEYENTINNMSQPTLTNLLFLVIERTIPKIGWRPAVQTLLKSFVRHFLRADAAGSGVAEICRMATNRIIEDEDINLGILAPSGNLQRRKFRPLLRKLMKLFVKWRRFMVENP